MLKKNCLITGATDGIGYELARMLHPSFRLILISRDERKGIEVKSSFKNPEMVDVIQGDLSILTDMDRVIEKIKEKTDTIDLLINGAAAVLSSRNETSEGFEYQFALNYLSNVRLCLGLLPLIKRSEKGSILNISSGAHYRGKIHWDNLQLNENYSPFTAYEQSKLAQLMFTISLSENETSINVHAAHPGLVNTKIGDKHTLWYERLMWRAMCLFAISPEKSAKVLFKVIHSDDFKNKTGLYFSSGHIKQPSAAALNKVDRGRLLNLTMKMIGY